MIWYLYQTKKSRQKLIFICTFPKSISFLRAKIYSRIHPGNSKRGSFSLTNLLSSSLLLVKRLKAVYAMMYVTFLTLFVAMVSLLPKMRRPSKSDGWKYVFTVLSRRRNCPQYCLRGLLRSCRETWWMIDAWTSLWTLFHRYYWTWRTNNCVE